MFPSTARPRTTPRHPLSSLSTGIRLGESCRYVAWIERAFLAQRAGNVTRAFPACVLRSAN